MEIDARRDISLSVSSLITRIEETMDDLSRLNRLSNGRHHLMTDTLRDVLKSQVSALRALVQIRFP